MSVSRFPEWSIKHEMSGCSKDGTAKIGRVEAKS